MPELKDVRTSLEVGFPEAGLPPRYARLRGRAWRAIGRLAEFPFEDEQFEVVIMDGGAVSRVSVREAHRVLKPEGRLFFTVPQRTNKQEGLALPFASSPTRGRALAAPQRGRNSPLDCYGAQDSAVKAQNILSGSLSRD